MLMFSLIIPTYNEKENIPIIIPRLIKILKQLTPFEIIVVDDNSPDLTWEVVQDMEKQHEQIKLIRRFNEKDLSGAVLDGFKAAKGEILGVMDADLQHDENLLPLLLEGIKEAPIVNASRYMEGCSSNCARSRLLLSIIGTQIANALLNVKLTDPMSGYFVLHRDVLAKCNFNENHPKGFKILLEIIYRSKIQNIREIPYNFRKRQYGASKLDSTVGFKYLSSVIRLLLKK